MSSRFSTRFGSEPETERRRELEHGIDRGDKTEESHSKRKDSFMTKSQEDARRAAALALAEREEYLKTRKWREVSLFGAGPESMTSDDYDTIHDVRRNIWTGGFSGFAAGLCAAALGSTVYPALQQRGMLGNAAKIMEPRHRTAALLIMSALGMAVGASTAGQKNSWRLTDIYTRGAKPVLSPYQKVLRGETGSGEASPESGDTDSLENDLKLQEWGWDPVKNQPSITPAVASSDIKARRSF